MQTVERIKFAIRAFRALADDSAKEGDLNDATSCAGMYSVLQWTIQDGKGTAIVDEMLAEMAKGE